MDTLLINHLTKRELEVLSLVIDGLSNNDIATSLSISIKTVESHMANILRKLNVKNRTQAAVIALNIKVD